jgi:GH15 family glucan-1,4-alpha-glucosidase
VLAFGGSEQEAMDTANATLDSDLAQLESDYTAGWASYCGTLSNQNGVADNQYYLAAMTLKSMQDESNGAIDLGWYASVSIILGMGVALNGGGFLYVAVVILANVHEGT